MNRSTLFFSSRIGVIERTVSGFPKEEQEWQGSGRLTSTLGLGLIDVPLTLGGRETSHTDCCCGSNE